MTPFSIAQFSLDFTFMIQQSRRERAQHCNVPYPDCLYQ